MRVQCKSIVLSLRTLYEYLVVLYSFCSETAALSRPPVATAMTSIPISFESLKRSLPKAENWLGEITQLLV